LNHSNTSPSLAKKKGLLYIPGGWIQKEFSKEKGCLKTFKTAKKRIFKQKKYL